MKKLIIALAAISFAGALVPATASADMMKVVKVHHDHCKVVKKKWKKHGHWVVTTHKVCS